MDNKEDKEKMQEEGMQYSAVHVDKTPERSKYEYKKDRNKYDDTAKRKEFKDKQFGDKKTIEDP